MIPRRDFLAGAAAMAVAGEARVKPKAVVFDAYGTLFDVASVTEKAKLIAPDPGPLVALWRRKQIEYTWLRALMERFEDFEKVTLDALRHAAAGLKLSAERAEAVAAAWLEVKAFPDVAALAKLDVPLTILSNGTARMLAAAVKGNGLEGRFRHVLSVDAVRTYKPSPRVYAMAPRALGLEAADILFVSSNAWDVAGAKAFGLRVAWCNRAKAPAEELGVAADLEIATLAEL
jgi:2-haloacid dehalogenase